MIMYIDRMHDFQGANNAQSANIINEIVYISLYVNQL